MSTQVSRPSDNVGEDAENIRLTWSQVSARIRPDKSGKGLWLFVDRDGDIKTHPDDLAAILGVNAREEDEAGRVAYAILPEEIKAIRDACDEWLGEAGDAGL